MITFMRIPNAEEFLRIIERSRGKVILHLPDGGLCDLKRDRTARQLLRAMKPGEDGLRISFSDPRDIPAFLRYMQEAA